jgi:hypothetical protein
LPECPRAVARLRDINRREFVFQFCRVNEGGKTHRLMKNIFAAAITNSPVTRRRVEKRVTSRRGGSRDREAALRRCDGNQIDAILRFPTALVRQFGRAF